MGRMLLSKAESSSHSLTILQTNRRALRVHARDRAFTGAPPAHATGLSFPRPTKLLIVIFFLSRAEVGSPAAVHLKCVFSYRSRIN